MVCTQLSIGKLEIRNSLKDRVSRSYVLSYSHHSVFRKIKNKEYQKVHTCALLDSILPVGQIPRKVNLKKALILKDNVLNSIHRMLKKISETKYISKAHSACCANEVLFSIQLLRGGKLCFYNLGHN